MKNIFIAFIAITLFNSCKEQYKRCDIKSSDSGLQLYNDILIELTEQHFYLRYLGQEGEKIMKIYRDGKMDSLQLEKMKIKAHNKIFDNSLQFKTVYLLDTITDNRAFNYFKMDKYDDLGKLADEFSMKKKKIISFINTIQVNYKADRFKSCTFNVKSIVNYNVKTIDKEIGIVSFSKIALNRKGNEGLICCNFNCGGLCGRGFILRIRKIDNHWIIISHNTTWIS
jgi:hypothetical protein